MASSSLNARLVIHTIQVADTFDKVDTIVLKN
jgi:hypothetical protein